MYRLIIADDEPLIIRGLKKMMNLSELDVELIGEAEDGKVLMQMILDKKPDIVISDISMPEKTGLEVLREIKEKQISTKVIFLSGYQEFSYAKDALTYGAVEYLLKPVTEKNLKKAIERAKELILLEHPDTLWKQEQKTVENDLKNLKREGSRTNKQLAFPEHIDTEGKVFAGVCFSLSRKMLDQIRDSSRYELIRFAIFRQIQESFLSHGITCILQREDNRGTLIVLLPEETTEKELEKTVKEVWKDIYQRYEGVRLVVGIGEMTNQKSKLTYIRKTAVFAAEMYYFLEQEIISYRKLNRRYTNSFDEFESLRIQLTEKIVRKETDWKLVFEECMRMIENIHYGSRVAVENRCQVMLSSLCRELLQYNMITPEERETVEKQSEKLRDQSSYRELQLVFSGILEEFLMEHVYQKETPEADVIYSVKDYIRNHFSENISLEQMAQMVYMHPAYFSVFFKKETGENFKSYLLRIRMEKALGYLMETNMKTQELAAVVGYRDVRTFTEKFKEFYGVSPSKYKKNMS